MIGETVSHYRVLERLGQGGMGEVFLAEDLRLHRPVALKTVRAESLADPEAHAGLLAEARAASALNHPNIAVIYEVDDAERAGASLSFIAMEYVAGETLAHRLERGPLPLDEALDVVIQVAAGLGEAHLRGVVHRDLKPGNVMVTAEGRVKVLDFGLASRRLKLDESASTWSLESGARLEPAGFAGTVSYMSPEQALGRQVDARSDVFSLGIVLHEALSGKAPFTGANAVETLDAILHRDPPPLPPELDDPRRSAVQRVLEHMLAKEREARYANLREVCDDLAAVRKGAPPPLAPPPPPLAEAVAVLPFVNITRNGEDDWLGMGIAETVTADLRGLDGLSVVRRDRVTELLRRLEPGADAVGEAVALKVGRELKARWVLSGGFQRLGSVVRVTAQLLDAERGCVAQTVKLDGPIGDIFSLQDRIARELAPQLLGETEAAADELAGTATAGGETSMLDAYEAFSRGVLNVRTESYEGLDRAVILFEKAIAIDPTYARAHLELGYALATKADYLVIPELQKRALACYRRAIELKPDLARAWREMGNALVALGREQEGMEAIQKALDLEPDDASFLGAMGRAYFIGSADFATAARYYERALERDPRAGWYWLQLAHCTTLLRELGRAEAAARRAAELQEAFLSGQEGVLIVGGHMRCGHVASLLGKHGEALDHHQRELAFLQRVDHALRGRIFIELHMRLGSALLALRQVAEAAAAFDIALSAFERRVRMGADDPFTRFYAVGVLALMGETPKALDSLERALRMRRAFTAARARIEPELASLRTQQRFWELVGA